ncbi:DUF6192 family protein, partial [Streptomyces wuyuanensis]|uniref:DUF6192 family protein n=1 Tax=Streptomyces wuyuanensis TaxID=1196353 RepID=UPI003F4CB4B7
TIRVRKRHMTSASNDAVKTMKCIRPLVLIADMMRGQEFTEDERETVRRQIGRVRAAADWLEAAIDNGEFTLDEQLARLLRGE